MITEMHPPEGQPLGGGDERSSIKVFLLSSPPPRNIMQGSRTSFCVSRDLRLKEYISIVFASAKLAHTQINEVANSKKDVSKNKKNVSLFFYYSVTFQRLHFVSSCFSAR